jgi:DNA-binding transcriptional ArsR family regulator
MMSTDIFQALADEKRRAILLLLQDGREWAVMDVVVRVGERQPAVSKNLAVLREAGVVSMHKRGRHRMYRLEAARLREVQEWLRGFEKFWEKQIDRIKERAEAAARIPATTDAEQQIKDTVMQEIKGDSDAGNG